MEMHLHIKKDAFFMKKKTLLDTESWCRFRETLLHMHLIVFAILAIQADARPVG